jgi:hypothetical protein
MPAVMPRYARALKHWHEADCEIEREAARLE